MIVQAALTAVAIALTVALAEGAEYRTFAADRTLEPGAHLGQVQTEFCHGTAQRIAVHSQLFGRLALVATMRHQNFAQVLFFKLAHGLLVGNAAGVHLGNQAVEFSFHVHLLNLHQLDLFFFRRVIVYIKLSRPADATIREHVLP